MNILSHQIEVLERTIMALRTTQEATKKAYDTAEHAINFLDQAAGHTPSVMSVGSTSPLVFLFSIFVMSIFVGYYVVWSVTPALHTPLMAVTNAISSVIVVGSILAIGGTDPITGEESILAQIFGFIALVLASVNISGGFVVTNRMLAMYKKK